MQRYFIPNEHFHSSTVQIHGEDAHHLIKVMRAQIGHRLICSNGAGREVIAEITAVHQDHVIAAIVEELHANHEPKVQVWIAQSMPKSDKLETVIQKCTEIGAVRIIPFQSERTIVQYDQKKVVKRHDRWCKIAKEAAEQAQRNRVPDIDYPMSFQELLRLISDVQLPLICYEKESGASIKSVLARHQDAHHILIIVGPEGGFTDQEVTEAKRAGCHPVGLGPRILRTETAAMVALSCVLYEYGEMGGS